MGWIYFAAWAISFYGQIYENYKHKKYHDVKHSVEGMNLDFIFMNMTGFTFYSIYTTYGRWVNKDQTGQVDLQDCFFAYHAAGATVFCIIQSWIYPRGQNKIHRPTIVLLIGMWSFVAFWMALTLVIVQDILDS
jgi:cystinosin